MTTDAESAGRFLFSKWDTIAQFLYCAYMIAFMLWACWMEAKIITIYWEIWHDQ